MLTPAPNKSRSVLGVTDLTLVAPLKQALIPALDSRSYESRLRLLLKTLGTLRTSSQEAEETPLIDDVVHRIRAIHSFRVAIVEKSVVLAVAFDGGWEPYMRRIWRDLGPLLDVIFCNCEGYLLAHEGHSYAQYAGWVRSAQVDTGLFYNASELSVGDLYYLRKKERGRIDGPPAAAAPVDDGPTLTQSLPALKALYRLSDMYLPDTADGRCLLRAALHLLPALRAFRNKGYAQRQALAQSQSQSQSQPQLLTEEGALLWFDKAKARQHDELPESKWDPSKVQGGIVEGYANLTHGCLVLIHLRDAKAAGALLNHVKVTVASEQDQHNSFVNLGFTAQGLLVAGVQNGTYDQLPPEFREGMAARAGILGDWYYNHPTRWTLPQRNWPVSGLADRVELSSVHAVVQFACQHKPSEKWQELNENEHPLTHQIQALDDELSAKGVCILSVQPMQRLFAKDAKEPRDRFGFVDGLSQPTLKWDSEAKRYIDGVRLGDLLLGHPNSLDDPPLTGRLWDDSSFLVVRKLKQDVAALNAMLENNKGLSKSNHDAVKALMMGRGQDGKSPMLESEGNSFDYEKDPLGHKCPLHSHVRRANPRAKREDMPVVPRIMRRGMSYGPEYRKDQPDADRGLVFMAYNASIAEQFEVIQSWLAGGNSGGDASYAALRDPFLGVPRDGDPHTFEHGDLRLDLRSDKPFVTLEWGMYLFVPSIRALAELKDLAREAAELEAPADNDKPKEEDQTKKDPKKKNQKKEDQRERRRAVEAQKGAKIIAQLLQAEQAVGFDGAKDQWKIALEDISARATGASQFIWTAVREIHNGALRTPYGVLVGSKDLVMEVFENRGARYSATGYAGRMRRSFGEIYLGMDDEGKDSPYQVQSKAANDAIMKMTEDQGFAAAYGRMQEILKSWTTAPAHEVTVELRDLIDLLLARLSRDWFGVPDDTFVISGGWHRVPKVQPTCPGHFHSPSRYMFQPNPGAEASAIGEAHGQELKCAVLDLVEAHRTASTKPKGPVAEALFEAFRYCNNDDPSKRKLKDDLLASNLIGVMMGFLPTVDGNLRATLYEWVNDQSLWDHQLAYLAAEDKDAPGKARSALLPPLRRTMQLRPVPELTWRTALQDHTLGSVKVRVGDRIVIGIVSATQQCLLDGDDDLYPLFGGHRKGGQPPTHACPGYDLAMGVLLGTLAALVETVSLRPTLSPMSLKISRRP